jgi:excisionase family DNA binding protein
MYSPIRGFSRVHTTGDHPTSPVGPIYTTAQVAEMLQVHRRTIQYLIERGELRAIHVGRRWRITAAQLRAFVARQDQPEQAVQMPPGEDISP